MKKNRGSKEAIFQGFIINIVVLTILGSIGIFVIQPKVSAISENKAALETLSQKYYGLKEKGMSFASFKTAKADFIGSEGIEINSYTANILKDISQGQFESYFLNAGGGDYLKYLENQKNVIDKKKVELEKSGVGNSIENVLPYYSSNGALSETAMTDFVFINYMENLLESFRLTSVDPIGVGELVAVEEFETSTVKTPESDSVLDGKIYQGSIALNLVGKKKSIIDFIYYIQNVGKVEIAADGQGVNVVKPNVSEFFIGEDNEKVVNNFTDIGDYFRGENDFFNNLVMDFETINFLNYPDSSALPNRDEQGLIGLIHDSQADERYEVEATLRFYIKGLPQYRINESIEQTFAEYSVLKNFVTELTGYIKNAQSQFTTNDQLSALNDVSKLNTYIISIEKDIGDLEKSYQKKENVQQIYMSTQSYNQGFDVLVDQLLIHSNKLSESIYTKYETILNPESSNTN